MIGPPGSGKTMLAQSLLSILPPLDTEESITVTQIYSAAGLLPHNHIIQERPFRSPHHTASPVSIIGGGQNPRPGEVSLAHSGLLFLDEMPEFRRDLLEALRQPLENGTVHIARAKGTLTFPARFSLIGAMNPCPCGYFGDTVKECTCGAFEVARYQRKISGPLLDRIDLHINVPRLNKDDLIKKGDHTLRETLKKQITQARTLQKDRFNRASIKALTNSELSSRHIEALIKLSPHAKNLGEKLFSHSNMSARAYFRIMKIAQTIADLEKSETVEENHLAEAFQYKTKNFLNA